MGLGKCWGRGTLMLKFDGSVVPVEEIVEGDLVRLHAPHAHAQARVGQRGDDAAAAVVAHLYIVVFCFFFLQMLFCVCS